MKPAEIEIESTFPMPKGRLATNGKAAQIRGALEKMRPGQSFVTMMTSRQVFREAARIGVSITTRKIDGGYRIWKRNDKVSHGGYE